MGGMSDPLAAARALLLEDPDAETRAELESLVRRAEDRGVVAFLDSRMVNARYAGFLQRSLPPFWPTTDRALVLGALERLDASAPPIRAVDEPAYAASPTASPSAKPPADPPPPPPDPTQVRTAVTVGEPWTDDEDEELRDGVEAEIEVADIAAQMGKSVSAVSARLGQLGLSAPEAS